MAVRIIAATQFEENIGATIEGDIVSFCARVSNPANQHKDGKVLLNHLRHNKHWSPMEMCHVVMEIITTRDIARQILRHRSFSFQEFSQRYAEVNAAFVPRHARRQDKVNRQNSIDDLPKETQKWWLEAQVMLGEDTADLYEEALAKGIAKECARAILPEGLTVSQLYMAGSLRSWYHYCDLRMSNGTQVEHQVIAKMCCQLLEAKYPQLFGDLYLKSLGANAPL